MITSSFNIGSKIDVNLTAVWITWYDYDDEIEQISWQSFLKTLPEVESAQFSYRQTTISFVNEVDRTLFLLRWS